MRKLGKFRLIVVGVMLASNFTFTPFTSVAYASFNSIPCPGGGSYDLYLSDGWPQMDGVVKVISQAI